jgi:hypothetical protein
MFAIKKVFGENSKWFTFKPSKHAMFVQHAWLKHSNQQARRGDSGTVTEGCNAKIRASMQSFDATQT